MNNIIDEAKVQYRKIEKSRQSPRFQKVVGRLIKAKLFQAVSGIPKYSGKLTISDCIWAGIYEPRILELLPALVIKKPSLFKDLETCPDDLEQIIKDIKNGQAKNEYHGIPAKNYIRWLPLVGHKGKEASILKSFRFSSNDCRILNFLIANGYSEVGAVREGLRLLVETLGKTKDLP